MLNEIHAKSLLRKRKSIDSWFISRASINLYRGCLHNCVYCDGRSESYYVKGDFGKDLDVKVNAMEVLDRELNPARKRSSLDFGYILLGGGVGDAYQPAEKTYQLARKTLSVLHQYNHPVHILTKSCLVERDLDLILDIHHNRGALVSMSFSSVDPRLTAYFEPSVPSPAKRLATLKAFKAQGIPCGMFLMPILPFVSDTLPQMAAALAAAQKADLDYVVFAGLTLKPGRQMDHYMATIKAFAPEHLPAYHAIYGNDSWGRPSRHYDYSLNQAFLMLLNRYQIMPRIPLHLIRNGMAPKDLAIIAFEQIDYLLGLRGEPSSFGQSAHVLKNASLNPVDAMEQIKKLNGIGNIAGKCIEELTTTGTCQIYQRVFDFTAKGRSGLTRI